MEGPKMEGAIDFAIVAIVAIALLVIVFSVFCWKWYTRTKTANKTAIVEEAEASDETQMPQIVGNAAVTERKAEVV